MRNTKVINLIEELKSFKVNIDIYDPWLEPEDVNMLNLEGVIDNPLMSAKKYDAIIVAVGHDQFMNFNTDDYDFLSGKNGVIIDVKNIVDKPTWKL